MSRSFYKKSLPSVGLSIVTLAAALMPASVATASQQEVNIPAKTNQVAIEETAKLPDRFIVKFKDEAKGKSSERKKAYGKVAQELGVTVEEVKTLSTGANVVSVDDNLTETETKEFIAELDNSTNVEYVEEDIIMYPAATPNDPYYQNQWDLHEATAGIKVPTVWDKTTGKGTVVAVVDSGILPHSDLNANVLPGYDMMSNATTARDGDGRDPNPRDEGDYRVSGDCNSTKTANSSWHGTHVAGTIAAVANNGKGISGVAPGAKIVPIRALGTCGGYMSDIMDSITWASGGYVSGVPANANKADVVNLSLGGPASCSLSMQKAIDNAVGRGTSVVAAAGNENVDASHSTPANCNNVITVAASDRYGNRASYSNYGATVDITAPGGGSGGGIASTLNTGTQAPASESYASYQGTSMATPHVSGIIALMKATDPSLAPAQIESRLKSTTRPLAGTCSGGCGTGLVDASKAVVFPQAPAPSPEPEPTPPAGKDPIVIVTPTPEPEPEPVATPTIKESGSVLAIDGSGVLWNYGNPVGSRVRIGSGWQIMKDVHVTDWNADGYQDILAQAKDGKLYYYEAKKYGGFTRYQIGNGWGSFEINVAKFKNADKYPSIIARNTSNGALYNYPNLSGQNLSSPTKIGSGWHIFNNLNVLDYDKDGNIDILSKDSSGKIKLYRTTGTGKFVSETRRIIGSGWQNFTSVTTMNDYNGSPNAGLVAKTSDGKLYYYETAVNTWKPRLLIGGGGWNPYTVASH